MGRAAAPGERFLRFWIVSGLLVGSVVVCTQGFPQATVLGRPIRFTGFLWCVLAAMVAFTRHLHDGTLQNLAMGVAYGSTAVIAVIHLVSGTVDLEAATLSRASWLALLAFAGSVCPDTDRSHAGDGLWLALPLTGAVACVWSTVDVGRMAGMLGVAPGIAAVVAAILFFAASYRYGRSSTTVQEVLCLVFAAHGWAVLAYGFRGAELAMTLANTYLLVSVGRDGMDILQRERGVLEYNRRAKLVIDQIACGVMVVEPGGTITVCNPAAARLLGIRREKVTGISLERLIENLPRELGPVAAALTPVGKEKNVQVRTETQLPGLPRYWRIQSRPVADESGASCGMVVVLEDLTDSKRMADKTTEARRMSSAGRLAASAAHEIRNPLAAIKGLLHLAQTSLTGATASSIRSCERIVDDIERTMTQILALVKPRTPAIAPVHLSEILPLPGVAVEDCADMPAVMADREALRQGFMAIADSAADAVPEGRSIEISVPPESGPGLASISLEIPGVVVSGLRVNQVFEPSFRANGAYIGFGLSIGRRLLEESGATVEALAGEDRLTLLVRLRRAGESSQGSLQGVIP
ncbi:MAG: PAS domain-containing protein [Ignavibacteriales bacterium]